MNTFLLIAGIYGASIVVTALLERAVPDSESDPFAPHDRDCRECAAHLYFPPEELWRR